MKLTFSSNLSPGPYSKAIVFLIVFATFVSSADLDYSVYKEKWKQYVVWAQALVHERDIALAVAGNGYRCGSYGLSVAQAKQKALACCRQKSKGSPCEIKDVNLQSDFIRKPVDNNRFCATAHRVSFIDAERCLDSGGLVYENKEMADRQHEKLKSVASRENNEEDLSPQSSLRERLLELKSLVEEGLITQEDYEKAKEKILNEL